jgi:pyruvate ferredoxin oxidoreductase alpha subunit
MSGKVLTGGGLLLKSLKKAGFDVFFLNSGTEYASLLLDYRLLEKAERPEMVVCLHEATAASAAYGYTAASGNLSAVLVHTTPGVANALNNIINAKTANIPVLLVSGITPFTQSGHQGSKNLRVHWGQETRNIEQLVGQFVKWSYVVKSPTEIHEAVVRAAEVMSAEHSALSACIGTSLCGARVFTSTSSQGLALMHEIMYVASGLRCPIVMAVANRALSAPINIHGDHSDIMGSRDSGWAQIFCESPQEAYHYTIQAFRLAEHPEVLLPVAVNLDGFTVSHSSEPVETLPDDEVKKYLPHTPRPRLDYDSPHSFGVFALPTHYFEFKLEQAGALERAGEVVGEVSSLYPEPSGALRKFTFDGSGRGVVVVGMGGAMGTVRHLLEKMGYEFFSLISVRMFSPFPGRELVEYLSDSEAVVVMDRALSPGMASPPLASNVKSALYDEGVRTPVLSVVYGLGGREPTTSMVSKLLNKVRGWVEGGSVRSRVLYLGAGGGWM